MNALNAYNKLNANVAGLKKSSEKLSSGYRINRAGDDAAGLAISEKMRSQIRGLNQAVRNSQDGINMIQTFEGAAQETHSILQRMKELASESANGTYDNATDRAAIQLEFDQLNDELNQIADTDFNGTIVLNGGVMADGTRATDGIFNYKTSITDAEIAAKATDISGTQMHTLADQNFYNKDAADALWNATGVSLDKYTSMNLTFMYDGEKWNADTVTDGNGNVIAGAKASGVELRPVDRTDATGKGGFEVWAGGKKLTNVIFDEMNLKEGDTITVNFSNSKAGTYAPENVGIDECYDKEKNIAYKFGDANVNVDAAAMNNNISVKLSDSITDEAMNQEMKDLLDVLDKVGIEATYAAGKVTGFELVTDDVDAPAGITLTNLKIDDSGKITYEKGDGSVLELATVTVGDIKTTIPAKDATGGAAFAGTNGDAVTVVSDNIDVSALAKFFTTNDQALDKGKAADVTLTYNGTNWDIAGGAKDGETLTTADLKDILGTDALTVLAGRLSNGDAITLSYTSATSEQFSADPNAEGTVEFGLNIDAYNFADLSNLTVHSVATPKAATMAGKLGVEGVSKSDAFGQSTGILTYTDNITLQTGARTKDAVNFTFSYNIDGTADMGNLKANLDLSSRANGLNTANLSLANQADANYAIDQIDKAINKTSMVRATFGAIQNRLEHKITNLTTTSENLTEAESSIRDTDMASEMMNYTKYNILQQAAQSMLAQANQQPQSILQLLG